jgi:cobalt-zinc-cadmium efflux system protein
MGAFLILFGLKSIVEGLVGENLHQVSEGFHICFHVICICCALASIAYSREHKLSSSKYTYGFDRFEVVSTFGNSIFLIFIASFALMEEVHEAIQDEESRISEFSMLMYFKLLAEIVVFVKLCKYLERKVPASPTEDNLAVIAIHCLSLVWSDFIDLFDSVFLLSQSTAPYRYFRVIAYVVWSVVAVYVSKPYIISSSRILLQCAPQGRQQDLLVKAMRDVKLIEGVIAVREEHFWQYTDDKLVATLVLKVHSSVDHSAVVAKAQEIMRTLAHDVTVEVSSEGA